MIELDSGRIHVRRAKNGVDSTHPLTGKEIRALRQLRRENLQSRYVFNTERGGPVTRAWLTRPPQHHAHGAILPSCAPQMMAQDKAKSRLEAPPTPCPRCKTLMTVRKCIPLPGREFVDVDYRCEECGAEVLRAVPCGRTLRTRR
jgi:hypothetical protein